jgi:hypothetical protein
MHCQPRRPPSSEWAQVGSSRLAAFDQGMTPDDTRSRRSRSALAATDATKLVRGNKLLDQGSKLIRRLVPAGTAAAACWNFVFAPSSIGSTSSGDRRASRTTLCFFGRG